MPDLVGYTHYQLVSVTGNKPAAPQAWFPMLVAFDADAGLNDHTQNVGLDVAFCLDGDDTPLPYEREEWTDLGAAVTARFWVRVPSVASVADTDLRKHIGKAGGTAYATPSDTWNENGAGNFMFVHHMNDITTSSVNDSTANGNNGTKIGANEPVETTGIVGKGQEFDGVQDRISLGNDASLNTTAAITMEVWLDWDGVTDNAPRIFDKATAAPTAYINQINLKLGFYGKVGGVQRDFTLGLTAITAGWKHVALTYDDADDTFRAYLNGAADGTNNTYAGALTADANTLYIGDRDASDRSYDGGMDEARWSKIARPVAWLLFGVKNIADYAGTITHGAWTPSAVSSAYYYRETVLNRRLR